MDESHLEDPREDGPSPRNPLDEGDLSAVDQQSPMEEAAGEGEGSDSNTVNPDNSRGSSEEEGAGTWKGGDGEEQYVDIDSAQAEYRDLRRQLTEISIQHRLTSRGESGRRMEEGGDGGDFDLTEYLRKAVRRYEEEGFKVRNIGLIFKNLTVVGAAEETSYVETCFTVIQNKLKMLNPLRLFRTNPQKEAGRVILQGIEGFCKEGEMLLVLGRPGAGCSTFLRVLANERKSYKSIRGEVNYGGMSVDEFSKALYSEVAYNPEDDFHYPTLTVGQTLEFSLKCKTPGKLLPEYTKKTFVSTLRDMLLKMFGLTHTLHTYVGNEFLRGISGGERKRLSIAEQMGAGAPINMWDGSTKGLDASSALEYVKSLRIMTNILRRATVVALYQVSESIYQLFDKVLVLYEGRCVYIGPTSAARQYFIDMGFFSPSRQTTSDFLTSMTDPVERKAIEGCEKSVPSTSEEMERVYKESEVHSEMQKEMKEYEEYLLQDKPQEEFRRSVMNMRRRTVSKHSPYTISFLQQTGSLIRRQYQLTLGNSMALVARFMNMFVLAFIVGTAFLRLPSNTDNAFTRGGVIFLSLLFNSLMAQAEIPEAMQGRSILYKHKSFAFYHPSAFALAQLVLDVPILVGQVVLWSVILYFLVGLQANIWKFLIFILIILLSALCMVALFRLFAAISPNYDAATRFSGISLLGIIVYMGYTLPRPKMRGWLVWVYYINPLTYAFKGLMSNEFRGLVMQCTASSLVPSGPQYTNIQYQTCALTGSRPGRSVVRGEDYLADAFLYYVKDLWVDVVILVAFWLFFAVANCLTVEYVQFGKGGYTTNVYLKGRKSRDEPDTRKRETQIVKAAHIPEAALKTEARGTHFTWSKINYTVPDKSHVEGKRLLCDVSGWARPGSLTALMGSSGAGKTTLLDVLAQRKNVGKIEGTVLVDGKPLPRDFQRSTGYCEQMDIHNQVATVRESLRFSAYLRQPKEVPKKEKDRYVEEIISLLEMGNIVDALVGDVERGIGISAEQRKRLTIAVELVAKPKLLFLDEPTSGLDAQAAYTIVRFLRKLADQGQSILCTIHQPSAVLFEFFDHLLLLKKGGNTVYFGEVGEDSKVLINYFERNGGKRCPPTANPAEYILDVVNAKGSVDWGAIWANSPEALRVKEHLDSVRPSKYTPEELRNQRAFSTSFVTQTWHVLTRMFRSWWRLPSYNVGRVGFVVIFALVIGFSFYRLDNSKQDLQSRAFVFFLSTILGIIIINQAQSRFMSERAVFGREEASKIYGPKPFAFSIILTEIPFIVVVMTVYFLLFYYITGMSGDSGRVIYAYLMTILLGLFSLSLGQLIAAFTPTVTLAALLNPFVFSMINIFCGVMIPYDRMPKFWRAWMYWVNPFTYFMEGVVVNELQDLPVSCDPVEYNRFDPPPGQICGDYMAPYLQRFTGYLNNPQATGNCEYCQLKNGQEYYVTLSWDYDHRWRDLGFMAMFWVFNMVVTFLIVCKFRSFRR